MQHVQKSMQATFTTPPICKQVCEMASGLGTMVKDGQLSVLSDSDTRKPLASIVPSQSTSVTGRRRRLKNVQGPTARQMRMRISCEDPLYMGLKKIKVSGKELSSLPKALFDLSELEVLDLGPEREACLYYHLVSLPDDICRLSNLTVLALDTNRLVSLPESLCELRLLERLALSNNRFTDLPEDLHRLQNLRSLYCSNNRFEKFPAQVTRLRSITFLDFSDNRICVLPAEIGNMITLESLILSYNRVGEIPDTIGQLKNLEMLWLCGNLLSALPKGLGRLPRLDWNRQMMSSALDGNPLTYPPMSIAKQGPAAIEKYLSLHQSNTIKSIV